MLIWSSLRLPETLHSEFRRSLRLREMIGAIGQTVRERQSLGYTLALTITFSALVAYISSIQQIIFDTFKSPDLIGPVFAAIAAPMALASWFNSRIVERFGLRRVGHSASLALASVTVVHATVALSGMETLASFIFLQGLTMACFAFASSNLGTLAMEHMAPIAGTASSVQGVTSTLGAAIIGFLIGRHFDGTPTPFVVGTAICAAAGFVLVMLTEPKRLFAPIEADPEEQEAARESTAVPDDLG
jgi:DHA1 family bicyclomycin/chloramphenicol resistance-like MFS transporter